MSLTYDAIVRLRDQASGPARQVAGNVSRMAGTIARAQQRLKAQRDASLNYAKQLTVVGAGAVAAGRKVSQAFKQPTDVAMSFEKSMSKVQALTRLDLGIPLQAKQLESLRKKALELGDSTSFTASQVAGGQSFLAMAGFKPTQINQAIKDVLNLAKAGDMGLARSADIASNIMSGFNLNAGQLNRVSDVMAYTFSTSNVNMQQLGATMRYVAPIASKAGASIEAVAALTGSLGDVGIQGTMAGTALRSAFIRLADPTREAQKALNVLGVSAKDNTGKMRPIIDVLANLRNKLKPLQDGDRLAALSTIFGAEAASGMTELVMNVDKVKAKFGAIQRDAAGTGEKVAKTMGANTAGNVNRMRSAIEGLQITLGSFLLPVVDRSTDKIIALVGRTKQWINANKALTRRIVQSAVVIGKMVMATGGLLIGMAAIIGPFALVRYALARTALGLFSVGGRINWLSGIVATLRVAALGGGLAMLGIGAAFADTGDKVSNFLTDLPLVGAWFNKVLPQAIERGKAALATLKAAMLGHEWAVNLGVSGVALMVAQILLGNNAFSSMSKIVEQVRERIPELLAIATPHLLKLSKLIGSGLGRLVTYLKTGLKNGNLEASLKRIANSAKAVMKNIRDFGAGVYLAGLAVANAVIGVKDFVGGWENLGKLVAGAFVMSKMAAFLGAIAAALSIVGSLAGAIGMLGGALAVVTLPVIAVVAGIAALAYGAYWLYQNWDIVKKAFMDSAWGQKIMKLIGAVKQHFADLKQQWLNTKQAFQQFKLAWSARLQKAIESARQKIAELKQWWMDTKQAFRDSSWGKGILEVVKKISDAIAKAKKGLVWLLKNRNPIALAKSVGKGTAKKAQQVSSWVSKQADSLNQAVNPWAAEPQRGRNDQAANTDGLKPLLRNYQDPWKKSQALQRSHVKPIPSAQGSVNQFMHDMKGQHELTVNVKSAPGVEAGVEEVKTTGNASSFNLGKQGVGAL